MNQYAPVLITTLNRYKHLRTTLESLKRCKDAEFTDVYIGLDYPPSEKYQKGYEQVCDYLEKGDFSVFESFNVIKRSENYGALRNSISLNELIFKNYETFIKLEDDIEVSVNFLRYMNSAFEYYKDDESVIGVTGYSYPVMWKHDNRSNSIKVNYVASTWGIGFWKCKFQVAFDNIKKRFMFSSFKSAYKMGKQELMIDACLLDYLSAYLAYVKCGNKVSDDNFFCRTTDVSMRAYLAVADKYYIMPTLSHTRNHGFDGSGIICSKIQKEYTGEVFADNYDYDNQPIDNSESYLFIPSANNYINDNKDILNYFDRRNKADIVELKNETDKCMRMGSKLYRARYLAKCYSKAAIRKVKRK